MSYQEIPIEKLVVNTDNDRHGPVSNEAEAISWHFDNLGKLAITLASDIAKAGQIYEQPLVSKSGSKYIVRDGNRRMTCLKSLLNPSIVLDSHYRKVFEQLSERINKKDFKNILCRVEDDEETINEIVHRRHTGGASGVGQVKWDAFAKENHLNRIGKTDSSSIGVAVANYAAQIGIIDDPKTVPSSTLKRLLSSKDIRERMGLVISGNEVSFSQDDRAARQILKQVIQDLINREVTLRDLWDVAGKNAYLDKLFKEGFAVLPVRKGAKGQTKKGKQAAEAGKNKPQCPLDIRQTLIPKGINFDNAEKKPGLSKIWRVWDELQTKLYINRSPCAVGVMFRCLIWFSVEHYISSRGVKSPPQELKGRVKAVAQDMLQKELIDQPYLKVIISYADSEKLVSVAAAHQWVHSQDLVPDVRPLRQMWETLERFLCVCLKIDLA